MDIVTGLHNIKPAHHGCALAMGNFDGVHRGHQLMLDELRAQAQRLGLPSTLITFEPQPREYFAGEKVPARLTRFREKVALLSRAGLDRLVCLPFNERTSQMEAPWVVRELFVGMLGARYLLMGDDSRFGRGAQGDINLVRELADELGFAVGQMPTYQHGDERISSTRIRQCLAQGDFTTAQALLGHEYFIMGRVVYGRQLGRQLGVPTANIRLQRYRAALEGVYAVTVDGIDDKTYHGVANIGVRPTVDGKEPLLETNVFDFSGDLYGALLTVTFKHKIRDERAFASIDELKAQIERDVQTARDWLAANA